MKTGRKEEPMKPPRGGKAGKKVYRYINIRQDGDEVFEGHPVYRIYNNKSDGQIGLLSFYRPWKCYVFSSIPECVFNHSCLRDVLDFIETEIPK